MESLVFESPKHFENVQVLSLEQTTFHPCAARALIFFSASLGLTCKRVYCMIFPPLIVFSTFYHEKNILSIQFVKFIDFFSYNVTANINVKRVVKFKNMVDKIPRWV